MAQHYKMSDWVFMPWHDKLKKRIDWVLKYTSGNRSMSKPIRLCKNLILEDSSYVIDKDQVNQVLTYRTRMSDFLDYNNTNLKLSDFFIELHCETSGRRNKLKEAFLVI